MNVTRWRGLLGLLQCHFVGKKDKGFCRRLEDGERRKRADIAADDVIGQVVGNGDIDPRATFEVIQAQRGFIDEGRAGVIEAHFDIAGKSRSRGHVIVNRRCAQDKTARRQWPAVARRERGEAGARDFIKSQRDRRGPGRDIGRLDYDIRANRGRAF